MCQYHHPLSILLLSALATGPLCLYALATTLPLHWGSMSVKHAWNTVPENWVCLGHPPADTTIDIQIALKPQHEKALIDALYEVSSPGHPKYGDHLSEGQVAKLVAPHADTLELVGSWLEHNGVFSSTVSLTHGGSWLTVTGVHVSRANDLLGASYQLYRHTAANSTVLRTISYSLPAELHPHVQTVIPTTYFGSPHASWQTPWIRSESGAEALVDAGSGERREPVTMLSRLDKPQPVTPSDLRSLYETASYIPAAADRNVLGIGGFFGQYPNQADLSKFMNEYRADGVDAAYYVIPINGGGYNPNNPGLEGNQNIQYSAAMAYPTPLIYYSTGGTFYVDDPFIHWLKFILVQPRIPQTITMSYGAIEYAVPMDLAGSICSLFVQLGARGVSVLVASGDDGVGKGNCKDPLSDVHFLPMFPATCPFVTSVGGTMSRDPEVAAELSGGGFSNYFPRESYQDVAVASYLQNLGSQYYGLYNPLGRAVPDISAQARRFEIIINGQWELYGGTSCAAPTVAGVISLLNDYRISKGQPPLGFLNPWLYGRGVLGLNDITSGSNPGCNTKGFSAIAGWDPVTGLGTPSFNRLKKIIDEQQPT